RVDGAKRSVCCSPLDERSTRQARRARRSQRTYRAGLRRRSRLVECRRRMDRRFRASATAPQADAIRRPPSSRPGTDDVRPRYARVGRGPAGRHGIGTTPMTAAFLDLIDLASERLGASVVAANDEFFAPKEGLIRTA